MSKFEPDMEQIARQSRYYNRLRTGLLGGEEVVFTFGRVLTLIVSSYDREKRTALVRWAMVGAAGKMKLLMEDMDGYIFEEPAYCFDASDPFIEAEGMKVARQTPGYQIEYGYLTPLLEQLYAFFKPVHGRGPDLTTDASYIKKSLETWSSQSIARVIEVRRKNHRRFRNDFEKTLKTLARMSADE